MQIKASLVLSFTYLFSLAYAADCALGGKHIGDSCVQAGNGAHACGDHRIVRPLFSLLSTLLRALHAAGFLNTENMQRGDEMVLACLHKDLLVI